MKKTYMTFVSRVGFCLVAVVLSLALMSTAVAATVPSAVDEDGCLLWRMDENGDALTGGDVTYRRYELPLGYTFDPSTIYDFANTYNDLSTFFGEVNGISRYGDMVWTTYDDTLYVTPEGRQCLDEFIGGKVETYRLKDVQWHDMYGELSEDFMAALTSAATADHAASGTHNVIGLADTIRYDITAWDVYDCVYTVEGAFYAMSDGSYGYVDYSELDNSYFDAEGNFSYRKGTVELTYMEGDMAQAIDAVIASTSMREVDFQHEKSVYGDYGQNDGEVIGVAVGMMLSDFLLPIAPLVVGLVLPRSKKLGYPKRWYILSAISLAWLITGVIRLVLLLA